MAGDTVRQIEKFTKKFLFHLPKMRHVDRRLPATQRAQQADRHKITEFMPWRVIPTGECYDPYAQSRIPIDRIAQGRSMSLFQDSQHKARMSS